MGGGGQAHLARLHELYDAAQFALIADRGEFRHECGTPAVVLHAECLELGLERLLLQLLLRLGD